MVSAWNIVSFEERSYLAVLLALLDWEGPLISFLEEALNKSTVDLQSTKVVCPTFIKINVISYSNRQCHKASEHNYTLS